MSRGPGHVMRLVEKELASAKPWRDGRRHVLISDLAIKAYGVEQPTKSQKATVWAAGRRHAIGRQAGG